MSLSKSEHEEIYPDQAHHYFKPRLVEAIVKDVQDQIINGSQVHLPQGQGVFIFDDFPTNEGKVKIAVAVMWKYDVIEKQFTAYETIKYHLFSNKIPDELLDEINAMGQDGKWNYPEDKPGEIEPGAN